MFLGIRDVKDLEKKIYCNTIHTFEIVDLIETIHELRRRNELLSEKLRSAEKYSEAHKTDIDCSSKDIRKVA